MIRLWKERVVLIARGNPQEDEAGYPLPVEETQREVLANKRSVKQSEFYAAAQNGLQADIRFELHLFEYEGERILEHEGKRYEVVRTYEISSEIMELTCSITSPKQKVGTDGKH